MGSDAENRSLQAEDILYISALLHMVVVMAPHELPLFAANAPLPIGRKVLADRRKLADYLLARALRPAWRQFLEEEVHRGYAAAIMRAEGESFLDKARSAMEAGVPVAQAYWVLSKSEGDEAEEAALAVLEEHGTGLEEMLSTLRPAVEKAYAAAEERARQQERDAVPKRERDLLEQLETLQGELAAAQEERDAAVTRAEEADRLLVQAAQAAAEDAAEWAAILSRAQDGGGPASTVAQSGLTGRRVLVLGDPGRTVGYREILLREFGAGEVQVRDGVDAGSMGYGSLDLVVLVAAHAKHRTDNHMYRVLTAGVPVVRVPVAGLGAFRRALAAFVWKAG